ncbi:GNAT family N-acetyltransferase [Cupriavidus plantarum]|uniref:GNAT family N-acetyltransferase n=1 Tax=Cupriavidus plantarum TaxID=942865 RepID=UPI00339D4263
MATQTTLQHAETEAELAACFALLQQLRPHLRSARELIDRTATQRAQGYRLLVVWDAGRPVAAAGYRRMDNLIYGPFLYIDDLVTDAGERGRGYGEQLIEAVSGIGRGQGCSQLVLDTGLANALAQRFYFRAGLLSRGLHFAMELQ